MAIYEAYVNMCPRPTKLLVMVLISMKSLRVVLIVIMIIDMMIALIINNWIGCWSFLQQTSLEAICIRPFPRTIFCFIIIMVMIRRMMTTLMKMKTKRNEKRASSAFLVVHIVQTQFGWRRCTFSVLNIRGTTSISNGEGALAPYTSSTTSKCTFWLMLAIKLFLFFVVALLFGNFYTV